MLVLEMLFVGQCEVFVGLDFVDFFSHFPTKLIGPRTGCQFFIKCRHFRHLPPKGCGYVHSACKTKMFETPFWVYKASP